MPDGRRIPWKDQCARCGARRLPDNTLCRNCWRKEAPYPKYIASGDGGSAAHTAPPVSRPHVLDDAERRELTRCVYCGESDWNHAPNCWGRVLDLDANGYEYRTDESEAL